jgi:Cu+-exporting ATPase
MCSGRLERALKKQTGVHSVQVNLATEQARVDYDPELTSLPQLCQAVTASGYQVVTQTMQWTAPAERLAEVQKLPGVLQAHWKDQQLQVELVAQPALLRQIDGLLGAHRGQQAPPRQRLKLVLTWVLTLPLLFVMIPEVQWVLGTLIQFGPGLAFYRRGWHAVRAGSPDMNTLVVLGTSAAYVLGCWDLYAGAHHVSFEASGVVIAMVMLGKHLEEIAKGRARSALERLLHLQPREALLIGADLQERSIDCAQLLPGDRVRVLPGSAVPSDGIVVEGESWADESMLTGESEPVPKHPGSSVVGGSVLGHAPLIVEVTAVGEQTLLARIARVVSEAQSQRPPIQHLADRVVSVFVPFVLVLALLTLVYWGGHPYQAITVLVVACPCAMGLAVPTSLLVGSGRAAQSGILFHSGESLQKLSEVQVVAFDKTGTLTVGKPVLQALHAADEERLLTLAAAVERGSEHPLARSLVAEAQSRGLAQLEASEFSIQPGWGARARLSEGWVEIGQHEEAEVPADWVEPGWTVIHLRLNGQLQGSLALADPIRPGAAESLRELRQMGLKLWLISGDQERAVSAVGHQLGVDHCRWRATPEQKLEILAEIQKTHKVAFVGDGINDAPALAQADVGIAVGSGTSIALESAQVVLMQDDLRMLVRALQLSRKVMSNIRWNLLWAFGYNVVLLPWAALGQLQPAWGATAMALSSLFVVSNALRLRSA